MFGLGQLLPEILLLAEYELAQTFPDIELMKKLRLNSKSLAYCQFYAPKSNLIPFDLERLKKQNENNR